MTDRFLKLNVNWMESDWLVVLSAESRLAWVQLLCYVKSSGINGKAKAKSSVIFAKQNFMGEESVEQMLRAAKLDGALSEEDGVWAVTNWAKHQGDETAADRQKRYRERRSQVQNGEERNDSNALRNGSNGEERRREEKRGDNPPNSPKGNREPFDGADIPPSFLKAATAWENHRREYNHKLWKKSTWESQLKKYGADHARFGRAVANSIENAYQGLIEPAGKPVLVADTPKPRRNEAGVAC